MMSISRHGVSFSALRTCSMCSKSRSRLKDFSCIHCSCVMWFHLSTEAASSRCPPFIQTSGSVQSAWWWCCCCYCVVCISIQQHTCSHQPPESRSVHLLRSLPAIITVKLSYRNSDTRRMCCLCCCVVPFSRTRTLLLLFKIRLLRLAALLVLEKGIPEGFALACQLERGQGQTVLIRL